MRALILAFCAAFALAPQTSRKELVMAGPAPVGPYSPAVKAGGLIYVSGTMAQDASGAVVGKGDVGAQTKRVIERIRDVLTAAGSSLEHVVAVTVYLRSQSDFAAMNDAYRGYWTKDPPTRTTVVNDLVLSDALVEMSMIAVPNGGERVVVHPDSWVTSPNPYSYAIRSGDLLFLAGLVSRNGRDNSVVPGDVAAQTKVVLDNAGELLKAAGMTHANVVSAKIYLPDLTGFQAMNEVYRTYFTPAPPARATVKAALAGPQHGVEITLVASAARKEVIDDGRPANPNLSAAIRAGDRLYVSGMLGNMADNKGDVAAQTRENLARIRGALAAGGATPADVVDSLVYVTDVAHFAAMNDAYRPFFGRDFPARTTVQSGLVVPDGLVEIMVTAVRGAAGSAIRQP
ncbi:MAG TPA: RidA family protein [Vicinamibacterales bacterium]|nr:RidA family protein [Vicinamibacterales bacterium]